MRRPKSLRVIPKSRSTRSNSANSLPSSPFLFIVPQYPSNEITPDDSPTPDDLMRQYASGRQLYPLSMSKVRKSRNLLDDDTLLPLSRAMSFHGSSSSSVTHSADTMIHQAPSTLSRSVSLSASQPSDSLSNSGRQIPFPTKPATCAPSSYASDSLARYTYADLSQDSP